MSAETKVRVRLDTRRARTQVRSLVRDSARAAGRIAGGVRAAIGRGMGMVGAGAAVGAGIQAVRGATQSGIGDVIGEALNPIGRQISDFFLGDLNEKAKAGRAAREATIQAFGAIAGARGEIPAGAKGFFDAVAGLREQEERGRELFEMDTRFSGVKIQDLIDRILEGLNTLLSKAVDTLADKLNPF